MPGGKSNIGPGDGKVFTPSYQPKNRRKSVKFLSELLVKDLNRKKEVLITGIDVVTGKEATIKVIKPSKECIVIALLKEAAKGNVTAIREIFDRIEGKPIFTAEVNLPSIERIGFEGD